MNNQPEIEEVFYQLLQNNNPEKKVIDYSIIEKHLNTLGALSKVGNSSISVFDVIQRTHIFYSSNFGGLLGYSAPEFENNIQAFFDDKIHPADKLRLFQLGISAMKLFINFSPDEKSNYKMINEYRILNAQNNYVRFIEQHQVLEMDANGKLWLTISIIDLSPNQEEYNGVRSQFINFKTGKIIPFSEPANPVQVELTTRELEILKLVKEGFISKEISDKLSISVHTVNTHRQRFLEKLGANNSMEAVIFASKLGFLD